MDWRPLAASLLAGGTLLAALPPAAPAAEAPRFAGRLEIPLGGEGGWDYVTVDAAARRVYVTHSTKVVVVDADKRNVIGEIEGLSGVHGVALAPDLGRGFISNGRTATVTIFDLKTLAKLGEVKTGENPDAILYDPPSHRVFTFNGRSHDATVFEGGTGKVLATIPLGGKPEFAVTDLQGTVFVNNEDKGEIDRIDVRKLALTARWPMAGCEEPTGLALDRKHHVLFAGCSNQKMAVVDAVHGKLLATLPIGDGVDGVAFDAERALAYSSNGEGSLTVVHEDSPSRFRVVDTVPTKRGARTLALDEKNHSLFLPTADFGPPPAPTAEQPHPRPTILPGTFVLLHLGG